MLYEKEEEKRREDEKDFANDLNVKLNYPVKFEECDGLLCFWPRNKRLPMISSWSCVLRSLSSF